LKLFLYSRLCIRISATLLIPPITNEANTTPRG